MNHAYTDTGASSHHPSPGAVFKWLDSMARPGDICIIKTPGDSVAAVIVRQGDKWLAYTTVLEAGSDGIS